MQKNNFLEQKAFTLIEVLVSVAVFSIVMLIATSAVFTIVNANKKSHSIKSVMTNLNFALESMMREIRMGGTYRCNDGIDSSCSGGSNDFTFTNQQGVTVLYYVDSVGNSSINSILRRENGQDQAITSQEVVIDSMKFYLIDGDQPRVLITVSGNAGKDDTMSRFNIQTTVTKRTI